MRLSDETLVTEAKDGSRAAFDELHRRYEKLVFRIAFRYARRHDAACDISQNIFLKVYDRLASFGGRSSFSTWLVRIAQNESVNWLRGQRRHAGHAELTVANTPSCRPLQETAVMNDERRRLLLDEVHRLNGKQCRAVMLRYFERMPIRAVAEVLDCSEGNVKNLLFRGLQQMRRRLPRQPHWNEETG